MERDATDSRILLGIHPNGYRFLLVPLGGNNSLRRIICEGGGKVPDELTGAWANTGTAQRAVENYIEKVRTRQQRSKAAAAAKEA